MPGVPEFPPYNFNVVTYYSTRVRSLGPLAHLRFKRRPCSNFSSSRLHTSTNYRFSKNRILTSLCITVVVTELCHRPATGSSVAVFPLRTLAMDDKVHRSLQTREDSRLHYQDEVSCRDSWNFEVFCPGLAFFLHDTAPDIILLH